MTADREQTRRDAERDPFADDVLERLIASNQQYQREHGHYIVPLSERLLRCRAELTQAAGELEAITDSYQAEVTILTRECDEWKEKAEMSVSDKITAWYDADARVKELEAELEQAERRVVDGSWDRSRLVEQLEQAERVVEAATRVWQQHGPVGGEDDSEEWLALTEALEAIRGS